MESNINIQVEKQINYHIIPFAFEGLYTEVLSQLKSSGFWEYKSTSKEPLLHHIQNLVAGNDDDVSEETIGRHFKLRAEAKTRKNFNLPIKADGLIFMPLEDGRVISFSIPEIQLYVFETNIGFLLYELDFNLNGNSDMDTIVDGNYYFKKLSHSKNISKKMYHQISISKEDKRNILFEPEKTAVKLIAFKVETYFVDKKKPSKSLVFNSVVLRDIINDAEILNLLYRMRRSFKDTYIPNPKEVQIECNDEIFQAFQNNYWGISLEGMANIAYLLKADTKVEDNPPENKEKKPLSTNEKNNAFFLGNYQGNVKSTYLLMYILTLHSRYSLLNFSIMASKLPKNTDAYFNGGNFNLMKLNTLREKIILFRLRCMFCNITNITHQAQLYDMLQNKLRISSLLNELENEVAALSQQMQLIEDRRNMELLKIEEEKQIVVRNKRKVFDDFILFVTTFFAIISTLGASTNLNQIIESIFGFSLSNYIVKIGAISITAYSIVPILLTLVCSYVIIKSYNFLKKHKAY